MSVKQLGRKRNQYKTLAFLAALNCDILKIEAWDNAFSWFMTDKSQLSEIILWKSPTLYFMCILHLKQREKILLLCILLSVCRWPFFIPQLCHFWYQRDSRNEPHWLCCHSPNWSAGIEKLSGILDPGRETKTTLGRPPSDTILGNQNPGIPPYGFCFKLRT